MSDAVTKIRSFIFLATVVVNNMGNFFPVLLLIWRMFLMQIKNLLMGFDKYVKDMQL